VLLGVELLKHRLTGGRVVEAEHLEMEAGFASLVDHACGPVGVAVSERDEHVGLLGHLAVLAGTGPSLALPALALANDVVWEIDVVRHFASVVNGDIDLLSG